MWSDPSFYLALSFFIFLIFSVRPFFRKLSEHLKNYGNSINNQLTTVEVLYQEAQALLDAKKQDFVELEKRLEILEIEAREKVAVIEEDLQKMLLHLEKISQANLKQAQKSLKEDMEENIRQIVLKKSYSNVEWMLCNTLTNEQKEKLTTHAIDEL